VYAGAKAALTNFSRALALELGPDRIRVNLIAPDTTPSEGSFNAIPRSVWASSAPASPELVAKTMNIYIPLGAPPAQEQLGDAVLFLASELSSSITGTTLHVDGGTWAASGFQHWPGPQGWLPTVPWRLLRPDAFD
jgi:NAD(P)-dependent dehydrogenase (short-subunit alcohol dehydrogenase family)